MRLRSLGHIDRGVSDGLDVGIPAAVVLHVPAPDSNVIAPAGETISAVDACFAEHARGDSDAEADLQAMLLLLPSLGGCRSREEESMDENDLATDLDERPESN
jgi:hypothetical protein